MRRTQTQLNQEVVDKYIAAGQPWPATARQMAEWAIQYKEWVPPRGSLVNLCADQLSRTMSEEYITDAQGRRVRAKHVVRTEQEGKQRYLWDDIRRADHAHMEVAFQQRRHQIMADCLQLKKDVDSYNENRQPVSPIQMIFDFTEDLTELELASV
jgi:hypothetical protein